MNDVLSLIFDILHKKRYCRLVCKQWKAVYDRKYKIETLIRTEAVRKQGLLSKKDIMSIKKGKLVAPEMRESAIDFAIRNNIKRYLTVVSSFSVKHLNLATYSEIDTFKYILFRLGSSKNLILPEDLPADKKDLIIRIVNGWR